MHPDEPSCDGGLLVIGNLNVDRIYAVKRLPTEGTSVEVTRSRTRFGGCGGNIALAAARLGVPTRLSSLVGPDLPEGYRERLVRSGIDLSDLRTIEGRQTPYCVILSDPGGSQMYAFHMGAMGEQCSAEVPRPSGITYCHAATSDPVFVARTFEVMASEGVETCLDPGQEISFRWDRKGIRAALENTVRFFGNALEWSRLIEMMGWDRPGEDRLLCPGAFDHIKEAIVTLGREGAALIDKGSVRRFPPFIAGEVLDPTGAGDAFRGAFYAALGRGMSSPQAVVHGNVMGGLAVTTDGAQEHDVDWNTLSALVRRWPAQLAHHSSGIS